MLVHGYGKQTIGVFGMWTEKECMVSGPSMGTRPSVWGLDRLCEKWTKVCGECYRCID